VRLGLAIADFTWPGSPQTIATTLRTIATTAEDVGFTRIGVMDHLWQSASSGRPNGRLGYLAAATSQVDLLTLVTAAVYREPGLLAKMVTTLDVLSGGRAWLGIGTGAGFNYAEANGLGMPFPSAAERFERLEETLQICLQMWSEEESSYVGKHYRLGRTLNSPPALRHPHPPVLIGGSGEQKTLRLVAQYADACNLFAGPDLGRKLDVLRAHCRDIGRDYDEIEKTVLLPLDPGPGGRNIFVATPPSRRIHRRTSGSPVH
jgi:F420-dependent oxidoreductase-like protein